MTADPDELRRFEQEARAIGQLNHPNILTIHDAGQLPPDGVVPDAPFIVTELLDGQTLRHHLARGRINPAQAIAYAVQVARGLAAAHDRGVIHRDLKPENLFVLPDGRVKILDFGIAKLAAPPSDTAVTVADIAHTRAGVVIGTAGYMSPEQARGERVGPASDLFAFGVILYEMLAGIRPFGGDTAAERIGALLRDDPPPLADRVSDLPDGIEQVVRRSMDKRPERRYPSAGELVLALESVAASRAEAGARRSVPGRSGARVAFAAAAVIIVLAAAGTWLARRQAQSPAAVVHTRAAPRVTPFLAGDAIEEHPAWSPAGNLIAYVSDAAGNADVWICDPSGSNPINLTAHHTGIDSMPAWSPDGALIAFFSERDGGGIFTMNALGGDVRRVVPIKAGVLYTFSLTWARDARCTSTRGPRPSSAWIRPPAPSGRPRSTLRAAQTNITAGRPMGRGLPTKP